MQNCVRCSKLYCMAVHGLAVHTSILHGRFSVYCSRTIDQRTVGQADCSSRGLFVGQWSKFIVKKQANVVKIQDSKCAIERSYISLFLVRSSISPNFFLVPIS